MEFDLTNLLLFSNCIFILLFVFAKNSQKFAKNMQISRMRMRMRIIVTSLIGSYYNALLVNRVLLCAQFKILDETAKDINSPITIKYSVINAQLETH